ncbi:Alpha/Beta hydrolase protein [Pelagophyceae sp. CCMP2097]|nr:Alpha/Beta hydrolase protein [Pelagophyceae sp. CCMP2097]
MRLELLLSAPLIMASKLDKLEDPQSFAAFVHLPKQLKHARGSAPLLLFLHGAGESGRDLAGLLASGATGTPIVAIHDGTALKTLSEDFVTVAPQTHNGWQAETVDRFLDFLLEQLPQLDESKLYIAGHSMGGAGALRAAAGGRFAACVAVAPAGSARPAALRGVPVWAFHGTNDVVVPSSYSERLVAGLRAAGAADDDARLTLYADAPTPRGWPESIGHASTEPAFSTPALYAWLLSHSKPGAGARASAASDA